MRAVAPADMESVARVKLSYISYHVITECN